MSDNDFARALCARIEQRYQADQYKLGWRLLYSPEKVLEKARVAFIGLNPGGDFLPADHAVFAMEEGSAYARENWGSPPGESRLQRQVLALFEMLGEPADAVLAGNLVPFRSPSWDALPKKENALTFGKSIWREILKKTQPPLVVTMGGQVTSELKNVLGVRKSDRVSVNWGNVCGERGSFINGVLVGIPHLSRFGVITRHESRPGLRKLFADFL